VFLANVFLIMFQDLKPVCSIIISQLLPIWCSPSETTVHTHSVREAAVSRSLTVLPAMEKKRSDEVLEAGKSKSPRTHCFCAMCVE